MTPDQREHIKNTLRQIREELQLNHPVVAYSRLKDLEEYLKRYGVLT